MGIYSRFDKIMEQDGTPMSVRTALSLINKALGEILAEQEGDFDTETRWALAWFEQNEFAAGEFGDANALALAKNTAVNALVHSGVVKSGAGKVQLIPRSELSSTWDPTADNRVVVWEITNTSSSSFKSLAKWEQQSCIRNLAQLLTLQENWPTTCSLFARRKDGRKKPRRTTVWFFHGIKL
jgi:adenine-specific DNA methylase